MPYALGAIQVQAGQTYTVPVGSAGTVGAVVCANESPYGVNASISATGAPGQWIVAQTVDLIACDVSGFNGTLTFTTDNYLNNAASAPSFLLYLTAFAPGEPIRGTYPAALNRLTNGGNVGTATNLVNDTNPSGTQILEARPNGSVSSKATLDNAGNMDLYGVFTEHDAIVLHPTTFPQPFMTLFMPDNANPEFLMTGVAGPGNYNGYAFWAWENGAAAGLFGIGSQQGGSALSYIDGTGVLHATAPVTLAAGNQETGRAGFRGGVNSAGDFFGGMVNFKTVMTNTPTSITLAATIGTQNVAGSATATQISARGFLIQWATSTASNTFWLGSYTTVGNCLLTVDSTARTLEHHCEICGHVSHAAPFSAIYQVVDLEPAMSYTCPSCGATEAFNCMLTAADEADTTPQGSGEYVTTRGAQATLIRALMDALGLPTA